jgi:hypothetical protein
MKVTQFNIAEKAKVSQPLALSPLGQILPFSRSSGSSCLPVPARQTGRIRSLLAVKPSNRAKGRTNRRTVKLFWAMHLTHVGTTYSIWV